MISKKLKKVLIVEDDPFISDIYMVELENQGYEVDLAPDGDKAMEKLNQNSFDLMLLDILMPQKDGFAVLKELKDNPNFKMAVIVLSNLGKKEHIEKAIELGANDYIIKTQFTPQEVISKIEEIFLKKNKKN
ncbi:MAG: response regulator transcription factor [Patescibacteria group bacterium]|nr:response regulator transcription factor [Patescibacteria group bacterium]